MTQGKTQFDKFSMDFSNFNRDGVDAFMKSGNIFAKGFEEFVRTAMTLAQDTAEKQAQYAKEIMSAKTLNEWAEVQNKVAQTSFEDFMSGATRLSELSVKLMTESTEPLNSQITKAVNKTSKMAA